MKAFALFTGATTVIVAGAGVLLAALFPSEGERHAILVSGWVAVGVQLFAFAVARLTLRSNPVAGWGLGALLRMVALGIYALVIVNTMELAPTAALISLATFFFLTTLVEPLLLNV